MYTYTYTYPRDPDEATTPLTAAGLPNEMAAASSSRRLPLVIDPAILRRRLRLVSALSASALRRWQRGSIGGAWSDGQMTECPNRFVPVERY